MQSKNLGQSTLTAPPIIFGGNVFGWTVDRAASFRLLDALVDAGLTSIDTAAWKTELQLHADLFKQLAYHLPEALRQTKERIENRLAA